MQHLNRLSLILCLLIFCQCNRTQKPGPPNQEPTPNEADPCAKLNCPPPSVLDAKGSNQKIAVPAYFDRHNDMIWNRLKDNQRGAVGIAIINQDSGHQRDGEDDQYTIISDGLKANNIDVYCYVSSDYGRNSLAQVKREIDNYYAWYNTNNSIKGIFVDETPGTQDQCSDGNSLFFTYYTELSQYIRGKGGKVIFNPGNATGRCYMNLADIIVTYEGTYTNYCGWQPTGWECEYPSNRFFHLIHGASGIITMDKAVKLSQSRNAGYVYVTSRIFNPNAVPKEDGNPWFTLPAEDYWNAEIDSVRKSWPRPDEVGNN